MKKIALLLLVLFISTSAFAALKPAPAKPAPVVQYKLAPVPPQAPVQTGMAGKFAIGNWGGWNTLSYGINADMIITGSTYYQSTGSVYGLLVKGDYLLSKINDVQPNVGVYYTTTSAGGWGTLGVVYGLSAAIATNLSVGADFILATYASGGGVTTTSIIPGASMKVSYVL